MENIEETNELILCLGSNREREWNIGRAAERLRASFVSARFAPAVYTTPVGCASTIPFLNQVVIAYTSCSIEECRRLIKSIEAELGRTASDKAAGRIPIDIDLLCWNGQVLKADDWARGYVADGVRYLTRESLLISRKTRENNRASL